MIKIFLFLFSYSALACQGISLGDSIIDLTNISSRYNTSLTVSRNNGSVDCRYFVGFTKGSGASYTNRSMSNATHTIRYDLSKRTNFNRDLKDFPDINNNNETFAGRFRSNRNNLTANYNFYLRPLSLTGSESPGNYQDTIAVKLYNGRYNNSNFLVTTTNLTVRYIIPYQIALSIVNSGAPHNPSSSGRNINFGNLETNESDTFDIMVVANSNFQIRFSSQNNGRMKHVTANSFVDYTLKISGSSVNLNNSAASPVVGASGIGPTSSAGSRFPSSIKIGTISNQIAGNYSDVVTVSVINI